MVYDDVDVMMMMEVEVEVDVRVDVTGHEYHVDHRDHQEAKRIMMRHNDT